MDPVAASTEMAPRDLGLSVNEVRTGRAYLIDGRVPRPELEQIAGRVLANGVIESIHFDPFVPAEFPTAAHEFKVRHVALRDLDDEQLKKLSREGHLFLSLAEMKAAQAYFREQGREPTDAELETLAQTWSEHCVHKTLKSRGGRGGARRVGERDRRSPVREPHQGDDLPEHDGPDAGGADAFCLSVFKDNAGVVAFDDVDAVCFKVETHNRPCCAIDPYGGSATGIGGVIRDVLGTGLAAWPVANTNVFCVADPNYGQPNALPAQGNPKSEVRNPKEDGRDPHSEIRNPQSEIRDLPAACCTRSASSSRWWRACGITATGWASRRSTAGLLR